MSQIIEVIVSPTGETKVETKGFQGSSCRAASQFLEKALGQATGERPTAEFYQTQTTQRIAKEEA
jgi:predicted lipase